MRGDAPYRGGRGGQRDDDYKRPTHQGRDEGPAARGGGQAGRKPLDQNSWQWKYRYGERPEFKTMDVTIDTVLPELPTEIRTKPSKAEFDQKMQDLDNKA